jgi:triphosphatase
MRAAGKTLRPPRKASRISLQPSLPVELAMRKVRGNVPGVLKSSNPEYVHQMRVGLPRLRSAMRFFSSTSIDGPRHECRQTMASIAQPLGTLRDWDVFVDRALPHLDLPDAPRKQVLMARREARACARAAVRSAQSVKLFDDLEKWMKEPVVHSDLRSDMRSDSVLLDYLKPRLSKLHRRVRRGCKRFFKASAGERHQLRIQIKRLRYAIDAVQSLFDPKQTKPYLKTLASLQNILGGMTDINTTRRLLGSLELTAACRKTAKHLLKQQEASFLQASSDALDHMRAAPRFWTHC